jgi:hypothetical protein
VQRQAEPVAELKAEGRVLVGEAELLGLRPDLGDLVGVTPGLISSIEASIHSRAFT